jgi:hypothetical protein
MPFQYQSPARHDVDGAPVCHASMMRHRSVAALTAIVGVLAISGTALAGSAGWLDPSFGQRGTAALHPLPDDLRLDAVGLVRSPRGVVVLMNAVLDGPEEGYYLSALTSTGAVDSQWHAGRPTTRAYFDFGQAWSVIPRATGPVVVGFEADAGITRIIVDAYRWDGTFATSFGNHGQFLSRAMGMGALGNGAAVQLSDGRLRICTTVTETIDDLTPGVWLLGLTAAGLADTTVGPDGVRKLDLGAAQTCNGIVADAEGRFIVAASGRIGDRRAAIVGRFAADGSLDGTFGNAGLATLLWSYREFTAQRIVRLGSSGFVVGGQAIDAGAVPLAYTARIDANGRIDGSYGFGGVYRYPAAGGSLLRALDVAGNGRLLLGIARRDAAGAVTETLQRINAATGRLDSTFGRGGIVAIPMRAVDSVIDGSFRSLSVGTRVGSVSTVLVQRRHG